MQDLLDEAILRKKIMAALEPKRHVLRAHAKRFPERVQERQPARLERAPATISREVILRADASSADDWRWRPEDGGRTSYSSIELATMWVKSLRQRLSALES